MSDNLDGPGTEAYSPSRMEPDGLIFPRTRTTMRKFANALAGYDGMPNHGSLLPPDPAVGGEMGQSSQLGWSTGFGSFRRMSAFSGRVITRPTMGANPAVGPVGRSNRASRLRARMQALYTDYTPSNQAVADEILNGGLK